MSEGSGRLHSSVGGFVVAGGAAGLTVHEAILADADFEYGLAQAAEFVALAGGFCHFALAAAKFGGSGSVGHRCNASEGPGYRKHSVGNVDGQWVLRIID